MTLLFIRVFFLIISTLVGYYVGAINSQSILGIIIGAISGGLLIAMEANMRRVTVRGLSSMVFGLMLGFFMAKLISDILSLLPIGTYFHSVFRVVLTLIFSYLGAVMALRGKDEFNIIIPYVRFKRQDVTDRVTLLDTSAIIDGRVADIYKTNFLEGRIVIPRFVLEELQKLSDSDDPLKRQRGRRGMEVVRLMQKDSDMDLKIHEDDIGGEPEVDSKLVRLARLMDARVCTTDFNLSRVGQAQDVQIVNINELANAVRAVVFAGEEMEVRLVKEGKEQNQAIAYLDDGTMVVVSDGRRLINQKVKVNVSSVLQTQAGRMIFAKLVNK